MNAISCALVRNGKGDLAVALVIVVVWEIKIAESRADDMRDGEREDDKG